MTDETAADLSAADDALLPTDQDQQDTTPADDAGADTVEGAEGEQPAAKKTAQDRIDELTRDKHAERRRAEALERELEQLRPKAAPAPQSAADEDPEPDPEDTDRYPYGETDRQFVKDLAAWSVRDQHARLRQQDEQQTAVRTVRQADADRRAEFTKTHPDFQDKLATNWARTPVMTDTLEASDQGPAVAYHLANNPDEAARIAALDPRSQIRELGKIEGRLTPAETKSIPVKTVSDAPAPAPNVRGAGGQFKPSADTSDFASFEAAYVKK